MTNQSQRNASAPFNDYVTPGILLLIALFCLYKSYVNINGYVGINGHWALSGLAFFACAILSRINTHLRLLFWLHAGPAAVQEWKQAQRSLQDQVDATHRRTSQDFFAAQEQRIKRQKRRDQLQEQQRLHREAQPPNHLPPQNP